MGDKVKVVARATLPEDSDEKLVQRELQSDGMRLADTKVRRGDVIEIAASKAEEFDALGATAEVGTIARLEREAAERIEAEEKAAREQDEADDAEAARRVAEAEARHSGDPDKAAEADAGKAEGTTPDAASGDGPRRRTRG